MNKVGTSLLMLGLLSNMVGCSPIHTTVSNQYKLEAFSAQKLTNKKTRNTILVSQPESLAGNQTEQMQYVKKPFELNSFAHNAWIGPPANMLYPLIMESLQKSGYFYAVASGPFVDKADYRLDTQLITLQQNYLLKPSVVDLVVKVTLTQIQDNRVIISRIITQHVPCPSDTPYGGVIAANRATHAFTAVLSRFVVSAVERDRHKESISAVA